jgi:purine nucleosidase/pyrimidine-specific ribonucleoside hydrolase
VIDTDPGLDDAVAILFALADPGFDVLAITTVAGNIGLDRTTDNAGRLVEVMGATVPVAAGAAGPLIRDTMHEAAIHGADGLGGVPLPPPARPPRGDAAALLADLLAGEPPGSVTVLALGPLTNLALLARDHPAAFARMAGIIAMGGTIHEPGNAGPFPEFNLAADPHAAEIVLGAGVSLTLVPLDVTRRLRATPADLTALTATPAARTAAALIGAYFAGSDRVSRPLHDPCVMLLARAPHLFGVEPLRLRVDLGDHPGRLIPDDTRPAISVAMTVDASAALTLLWQGLGGGARP